MQHITTYNNQHTVHHIISGHGSKSDARRRPPEHIEPADLWFFSAESDISKGAGGFALFDINSNRTNVDFYNANAKILYQSNIYLNDTDAFYRKNTVKET